MRTPIGPRPSALAPPSEEDITLVAGVNRLRLGDQLFRWRFPDLLRIIEQSPDPAEMLTNYVEPDQAAGWACRIPELRQWVDQLEVALGQRAASTEPSRLSVVEARYYAMGRTRNFSAVRAVR